MKNILFLFVLLTTLTAPAQYMEITPTGPGNLQDPNSTYWVLNVPGASAGEIYTRALAHLNTLYNRPRGLVVKNPVNIKNKESPYIRGFFGIFDITNTINMRGKTNLHRNLIQAALFPTEELAVITKADRLEVAKDKIACRYYYYASQCRMLYADCIRQLSLEFDRAERTIIENLEHRRGYIQKLVDDEAGAAELKKRFPWLDWSYRPR